MSDDDEDYASFGTPLEPLEEDVIQAKKAPRLEDQVAVDQQGRRRFHGAFSGGFSAGYYNSVGTKEGWTPQTFVSTRGERAKNKKLQPQDFMDEEDLSVHGIAPQAIRATSSYDSIGGQKRKRVFDPDGPIPGAPVLEDILRPSSDTMGMKILRKLGWKPGQGIGPRVKHKQKKNYRNRVVGCQGPPGSKDSFHDSDNDMDTMEECMPGVTFAPDDVDTLDLSYHKSDQFGMGYKPLDRTSVLGHMNLFDSNPLSLTEKKKKLLVQGQAFGVGAFEEEDEDIYATEDMSNYDFTQEDHSKKKNTKENDRYHQAIQGITDRLEGFKLSSQPLQTLKNYPLPKLPKDFIPHHKPRRLRFERRESDVRGLGRHDLTQQQRAEMIKERRKSKFEVRSGVKQEPKETLSTKSNSDRVKVEATAEIEKIYEEFKSSGSKNISEFKPFAKETEKQRRYELYLKMKAAGHKDRFHLALPRSMTEWEKEREIREFYRAAQLFQPLTSTMQSRFVTATLDDKVSILKDGLNVDIPKVVEQAKIDCETDALGGSVKDDRIKAARMNMFGRLTQYTDDWHPDKIVCRRFNIPNPYSGSSFVGTAKVRKEKFSLFNSLNAPIEDTAGMQSQKEMKDEKYSSDEDNDEDEEKDVSEELSNDKQASDESKENYGLKVPVDGPPTMDLFKAIFQDSDSDDSDKEEDNDKIDKENINGQGQKSDQTRLEKNNSNSVDIFLTAMRNTSDSNPDMANKGPRISRFDRPDRSNQDDSNNKSKHIFVPRKKDPPKKDPPNEDPPNEDPPNEDPPNEDPPTKDPPNKDPPNKDPPNKDPLDKDPSNQVEPTSAKGIFANIDFEAINSYRNYQPHEDDSNKNKYKENESDSSIDSDDGYGPPIPSHLKGRNQMIAEPKKLNQGSDCEIVAVIPKVSEKDADKKWKEKNRLKKKTKHKEKHKHKKEKKKKKHKEQKHKKHSKKSKKRRSSSSSDSSESSSD